MPIFEVELIDDSRKNDDGSLRLFLKTVYTENGRTGSGELFRIEITKDQVYFDDNGNDGQRFFGVKLSIDNKVIAKARATSKKKAEEIASKRAYFAFQEKMDTKF